MQLENSSYRSVGGGLLGSLIVAHHSYTLDTFPWSVSMNLLRSLVTCVIWAGRHSRWGPGTHTIWFRVVKDIYDQGLMAPFHPQFLELMGQNSQSPVLRSWGHQQVDPLQFPQLVFWDIWNVANKFTSHNLIQRSHHVIYQQCKQRSPLSVSVVLVWVSRKRNTVVVSSSTKNSSTEVLYFQRLTGQQF